MNPDNEEKIVNWVIELVKGLVSNPDEVSVKLLKDEQGTLCKVKVADGDVGKVIGKGGNIASAIRVLVRSAGFLVDEKISTVIESPYPRSHN